jgi:hypothetical protein
VRLNNEKYPEKNSRTTILLCIVLLFSLKAMAQVEVESPQPDPTFANDTWHMSVSPYLWAAGFDGNLSLMGHDAAVHQSFGDIFSNLKFRFMGLGEVRRGRVGLLTDVLFLRAADETAVAVPQLPISVQVKLTASTFLLTPLVAYRV